MPSKADLYLAIDQGGHASRAIAFDGLGAVHADAFAAIETQRRGTDQVEHDPDELVASVRAAIADLAAALGRDCKRLRSAGLACQRSSIVCWDRESGAPLSPVISWQDRRAAAWLERLQESGPRVHDITGLVLSPHYGASKMRWCLDHLPAVADAHRQGRLAMAPLSTFLLFQLLPEHPLTADPANASRTLLWDFSERDWSPELLQLFAISRSVLPRCAPSRYPYGTLSVGRCKVPLRVSTGDQSAALFAFGEPATDSVFANLGTGAFVQQAVGDRPLPAQRLLSSVVYQDEHGASYVMEGTVNGAGSALAEVADKLQIDPKILPARSPEWLMQTRDPPLFLNGVSGLGSPYWVAEFKSRFLGPGGDREKIVAVLESIVFLLAVNLEELALHAPLPRRLVISGGLAAIDPLCQRLADLSGIRVARPWIREATARGLSFLLASRPERWPAGGPERAFSPRENPPLAARFKRWRAAMDEALMNNPANQLSSPPWIFF